MDHKVYRKSRQREKMMELLLGTDTHPTANWLYDKMREEFPSLSLGTVYRNLGILEDQGKVVKLSFGSTFDRYDAFVEEHPHFICKICGRIFDMHDMHIPDLMETEQGYTRHRLETVSLKFQGICKDCLDKELN